MLSLLTWSAALPGAAVRVTRTAVGRRALQVVLLVGGLFALGFLCGGQAQAADGTATTTTSISTASAPTSASGVVPSDSADGVGSLLRGVVEQVVSPVLDAGSEADADAKPPLPKPSPDQVLRPVADHVIETVNERVVKPVNEGVVAPVNDGAVEPINDNVVEPINDGVVKPVNDDVVDPVGDLVETVNAGLAEVQATLPPLVSLPALPILPALPELPTVPEIPPLPTLPTIPSLPTLPGLPVLPGQTLPAPVTSVPQQPGTSSDDGQASAGQAGGAAGVTYGPRFTGDAAGWTAGPDGAGHRAVSSSYAPVHQAPGGDPNGSLGTRPAADSGTSRHGDAHAVTQNNRAPLRLVPGSAARVDAAETRDRFRDIPVFPG